MKKVLIILLVLILIILGLGIYKFNFTNDDIYNGSGEKIDEVKEVNEVNEEKKDIEKNKEVKSSILLEIEARSIAEGSCIKGGESLSAGLYNKNTKTWWYDANLNATREGCNPACVVNEETKTAEINWRCTGLKEPVACTMDAMECPDGSYVGRTGPNCQFVCPQ